MTDPERARDLALRRKYNITLEEYKSILASQGHRCPICLKPLSGISNPVDHDHISGLIRGVTCTYDNQRVIGRNRDWEKMYRLAMYLKEHPAKKVVGHRQVPPKKRKSPGSTRKGVKGRGPDAGI